MRNAMQVFPSHSLLLVGDRSVCAIPDSLGGGIVAATDSCIAIGTRNEHDGPTLVTLTDEVSVCKPGTTMVFDGVIETPRRLVSVFSVVDDVILEMPVPEVKTRIRVCVNHPTEPDDVVVLVYTSK